MILFLQDLPRLLGDPEFLRPVLIRVLQGPTVDPVAFPSGKHIAAGHGIGHFLRLTETRVIIIDQKRPVLLIRQHRINNEVVMPVEVVCSERGGKLLFAMLPDRVGDRAKDASRIEFPRLEIEDHGIPQRPPVCVVQQGRKIAGIEDREGRMND